jgi:chromosome partitioning protein
MANPGRVLAVVNQKGGVGKTTTAVNLAASFAASERRTLLIDLDPQANASSAFGHAGVTRHVYDALIGRCVMKELTLPTELETLTLVPSGRDLYGAEIELVSAMNRERRFERALGDLRNEYELILVDCPPSLGLLTLNGLTAATGVIIPLQCEYYALEGLAGLLETIELVRGELNPGLVLEGVLLTMFDPRNRLSRQVEDEVRSHFGDRVFSTVIPRNVRLSEAPSHGKPVLLYDAHSKGAVSYLRLAEELLQRFAPAEPLPARPTWPAAKRPERSAISPAPPPPGAFDE